MHYLDLDGPITEVTLNSPQSKGLVSCTSGQCVVISSFNYCMYLVQRSCSSFAVNLFVIFNEVAQCRLQNIGKVDGFTCRIQEQLNKYLQSSNYESKSLPTTLVLGCGKTPPEHATIQSPLSNPASCDQVLSWARSHHIGSEPLPTFLCLVGQFP